jgi:chorismate dehydratase
MRIGAVNYLNSKPLVHSLGDLAVGDRLLFDLPSRLADSLGTGRLDVALIPSVELFRAAGYKIVSDACVACAGAVRSVKLHFRVPPSKVSRIALDEGSRTSAALALVLLEELAGVRPVPESLPIGCGVRDANADAVLLIGDRAMQPTQDQFVDIWDLGDRWFQWTGLPFVFAMWVARSGVDTSELSQRLATARDRGVSSVAAIAAREAPELGLSVETAHKYLRDNLHFTLGERELEGLERFRRLCADRGLVPSHNHSFREPFQSHGCIKS